MPTQDKSLTAADFAAMDSKRFGEWIDRASRATDGQGDVSAQLDRHELLNIRTAIAGLLEAAEQRQGPTITVGYPHRGDYVAVWEGDKLLQWYHTPTLSELLDLIGVPVEVIQLEEDGKLQGDPPQSLRECKLMLTEKRLAALRMKKAEHFEHIGKIEDDEAKAVTDIVELRASLAG